MPEKPNSPRNDSSDSEASGFIDELSKETYGERLAKALSEDELTIPRENEAERTPTERKLVELAKEFAQSPSEHKAELDWIVRKSSWAIETFGHYINEEDENLTSYPLILDAMKQKKDEPVFCSLVFGYLRRLSHASRSKWEQCLEIAKERDYLGTTLGKFRLMTSNELTDDDVNKILDQVKKGDISVDNLAWSSYQNNVKPEVFREHFQYLLDDERGSALVALHLVYHYLRRESKLELPSVIFKLLRNDHFFKDLANHLDAHRWGKVALWAVEKHPAESLCLVGNLVDFSGKEGGVVARSDSPGFMVLSKIHKFSPKAVWEVVSKPFENDGFTAQLYVLSQWLERPIDEKGHSFDPLPSSAEIKETPLELVEWDELKKWIEAGGKEAREARAIRIARLCPRSFFDEGSGRLCYARRMLIGYGEYQGVWSGIASSGSGIHSVTYWADGPSPQQLELNALEEYLPKESNTLVRKWINEYCDYLKDWIARDI